ncbi:MAG: SDR family NAD(P)-dependent oxidoreductase, partial [Burkholderiales bacterium]|nr:SDR family NAD(P)-dependent oxidoreductase [Burkholderiales bacterium]
MRLHQKVAVITGAAGGIGWATAQKFAREGAIVVVVDLKPEAVDRAVRDLQAAGSQARGFALDVTQRPELDAMVMKIREVYGR